MAPQIEALWRTNYKNGFSITFVYILPTDGVFHEYLHIYTHILINSLTLTYISVFGFT